VPTNPGGMGSGGSSKTGLCSATPGAPSDGGWALFLLAPLALRRRR
jgi:Synergist-CTERM protein sorting domain-containing protein